MKMYYTQVLRVSLLEKRNTYIGKYILILNEAGYSKRKFNGKNINVQMPVQHANISSWWSLSYYLSDFHYKLIG